jgi:hypothetical protein
MDQVKHWTTPMTTAMPRGVRLVAERGAPISAELHDLLVELLAASDWASAHDDDLAVLARLRT